MSEAEYRKRQEAFTNDPETLRLHQEVKAIADSEGLSHVNPVLNRAPFRDRLYALHVKHGYWVEDETDPATWNVDTAGEFCRRLRKLIDAADKTRRMLGSISQRQSESDLYAERVRSALRLAKPMLPEDRRLEVDKMLLEVAGKLTLDDRTRWYIRIVELLSTAAGTPDSSFQIVGANVPASALSAPVPLSAQWGNGATRREVIVRVLTYLKSRTPFNATIHDLGHRKLAYGTPKDLRLVFSGKPAIVRIVPEDAPVSVDGTLGTDVGRAATDAEAKAAWNWFVRHQHVPRRKVSRRRMAQHRQSSTPFIPSPLQKSILEKLNGRAATSRRSQPRCTSTSQSSTRKTGLKS